MPAETAPGRGVAGLCVQAPFRYSDTVSINCEVHGHGAAPVVFLHGFAAALTTWRDIVPFFPAERYTLHLLDLKGFGRSSRPRDGRYRPEDQAAVVAAYLEERKLKDAVLVGHSLGGGIALLACLLLRERDRGGLVGRLVLIDPAAYPQKPPSAMRLLRAPLLGWSILHLLPVSFMVRFTMLRVYHDRRTITPERVARYVASFSGRGIDYVFIESARRLIHGEYTRLIPAFRTIDLPVLIIWGREDRLIPLGQGLRLRNDIPGARLDIIEECGHVPQEERPAETWAAIRDFLENGS